MATTKSSVSTRSKSARKSSARKTAPEVETEQAARNRANAANRVAGKADTTRNHDANPDVSTDSSVRHAEPQTGKRAGEGHGGYPAGEYDVVNPSRSSDVKTKGPTALEQLFDNAPEADRAVERSKKYAQLSPNDFDKGVEALPVGTIIEHEAPNRWRVHVVGQGRYGHGATHSEAVEAFITGQSQTTAQVEADAQLAGLPESQQQEIAERDAKAARAVGGTAPDTFARIENAKAAEADLTAKAPALNAATDGPEKASARDEAGRTSGDVAGTEGTQAK